MNKYFCLIIIFLGCYVVDSQVLCSHEISIVGKKFGLITDPMHEYFNIHAYKLPDEIVVNTIAMKDYFIYCKVEDNKLYLNDIIYEKAVLDQDSNMIRSNYISFLDDVFQGKEKVWMDWYSGDLYVASKVKCVYSKRIIPAELLVIIRFYQLHIENGNLISMKKIKRKELPWGIH